ncbi:MAG: hypothetical protein ACD_67C00174G0002, partial [uncultured bacterium]
MFFFFAKIVDHTVCSVFCGLLDSTSIENCQISIFDFFRQREIVLFQKRRDSFTVADIHLTAEGFNEIFHKFSLTFLLIEKLQK